MDHRGLLTAWSDDKGFGFITPAIGGERVFAHISAYAGRGRPSQNREVRYSLTEDAQGRVRAAQFQYTGIGRLGASVGAGVWLALLIAAGLICGLGVAAHVGHLPLALPAVYGLMSLVCVLLYALDKAAATAGRRRIPEKRLHMVELLGGWPGALIGQQVFRHKTRKRGYQFAFRLCIVLNLAALAWLLVCPEAGSARQQLGIEPLALDRWRELLPQ